ncbi:Hpt domain-containing protein [Crocosphaera watsonii]|uniref:Two-component hybrid sensor & regulator n=1 Tax=Crocosphaera watsonii WH 8502 TaxID=423474 RepID=T2IHB2_CROWT|nr:Hpt domain-containing protein [Crocosphaera watsonii]CCQ52242.1 two-component hybrid sensor & regulator [Crocosphaera watsonii WH 8502]
MKFELDEITLAEMTKEARQCFLDEDAPEYICVLNTEIEKGYENANFTELLRAAHSLKGGAGIAQLFSIMELSHSFEDILAIIQKLPNSRTEEAWVLLEFIVNEITILLHQAEGDEEIFVDAKLLKKLADFIDSYSATATNIIPEKSLRISRSNQNLSQ